MYRNGEPGGNRRLSWRLLHIRVRRGFAQRTPLPAPAVREIPCAGTRDRLHHVPTGVAGRADRVCWPGSGAVTPEEAPRAHGCSAASPSAAGTAGTGSRSATSSVSPNAGRARQGRHPAARTWCTRAKRPAMREASCRCRAAGRCCRPRSRKSRTGVKWNSTALSCTIRTRCAGVFRRTAFAAPVRPAGRLLQ